METPGYKPSSHLGLLFVAVTLLLRFSSGEALDLDGSYIWRPQADGRRPHNLVPCQGRSVDLVYVLDASSSIWPPHWDMVIDFLSDLTRSLEVSHRKTRVGLVTFTNEPHVAWRLGDRPSTDDILGGLRDIYQQTGSTKMSNAIRFLRTRMFSEAYGGRRKALKVAIMITDGNPYEKSRAIREALYLKILTDIQLVVVGIGHYLDTTVLGILASQNQDTGEKMIYTMRDYKSLNIQLAEQLQLSLCQNVNDTSGTVLERWTCNTRQPTDVVFIADLFTITPQNMLSVSTFIKSSIEGLPLGYDRVSVGILPENLCNTRQNPVRQQQAWISDESVIEKSLESLALPTLSDYLFEAKQFVFTEPSRRNIAVTIVDEHSNDEALAETIKLFRGSDVEVISIEVEGRTWLNLQRGGVTPTFNISSYSQLESLTDSLTQQICSTSNQRDRI